ncbi:MAG TPA: MerR family transcriptional regulator, partial [bacterium]|nr:MerR family transcriptional regulator [bacterium]
MPRAASSKHSDVPERDRPRYAISVVAEMLAVHPQTLRLYERHGLLTPRRTAKRTRMYSESDVQRLEEILTYTRDMGINLAGVEVILHLKEQIAQEREEFQKILEQLAQRFQVTLEEYGVGT